MTVILYTTKTCPRCVIIKKWLEDNGISFIVKNIEDTSVITELTMRNAFVMSAPVLEIEGMVFEFRGGDI